MNTTSENFYKFKIFIATFIIFKFYRDVITLNKMKLSFFIKINAFLIMLILFFNKKTKEMKLFIKFQGDELEEIILKFLKLSTTHRYIPNRILLCLHYLFIKILISEENEEFDIPTCRKIEKKEKFLHKKNYEAFFKPQIPKYFYNYEKANQFIEKFYRRNIVKKEKADIERVVIVNILKILLSTIENNSSTSNTIEYTKDYIPEIILKYYYVDQGNMNTFTVENHQTHNNAFNLNISNNNISQNGLNNSNNLLYDDSMGKSNNNISGISNNNSSSLLNSSSNQSEQTSNFEANNKKELLDNNNEANSNNTNANTISLINQDPNNISFANITNQEKLNFNNISLNKSNNLINYSNENEISNNNITNFNLLKYEEKENVELNSKTYLEILQSCSQQEADFYNIIDVINKVSITSLIIYFYYLILKTLQNYDLIQYSYFSFHLIDSNGLLVFLKILSQDFKAIEQQFITIYETDVINIQYGELIEFILLFDLKLIYKTCFKNEEYIVKYLVECKLQAMLKKVLNNFPQNERLKKYCMKLFKCQLKFFDKNWRLENANIISSIYLTLKIRTENITGNLGSSLSSNNTIENYLKYEKKDKVSNSNPKEVNSDYFSNDELKKIHSEYHIYNYNRFYNNSDEFEKYQNSIYQSNYARIYLDLLDKASVSIDLV